MKVAKMAEESEIIVTSESGEVQKAYTCKHEGCTFTCAQIKGLKVHLMSHLRQVKYRCGYCHLTGSSQYQLRRHCQHVHANKRILVHSLKPEGSPSTSSPGTTAVVTPIVVPQQVTVVEPSVSKKASPTVKTFRAHQCPYCPYSHSLIKMISRHMMRHYVEKPFQCGYCKRTGIEKFDILYHCRKVHADREPKVISIPMPTNPEIRPILRRGYGHLRTDETEDNEGANEENDSDSALTIDEQQNGDAGEAKFKETRKPFNPIVRTRRTYECSHCEVRRNTKNEIKKHLRSAHDDNGPRYRVIVTAPKKKNLQNLLHVSNETDGAIVASPNLTPMTANVSDDKRTSLLKCIYCDLASDSLKLLRKHCHEAHTDSEVRLRKLPSDWEPIGESVLRCGYCGFAVTKMADLWEHHCQEHTGKSVKFRVSVRKSACTVATAKARKSPPSARSSADEAFWCSYCNDPCESLEKMIRHWKMFHGHLEFKYRPKTEVDGGEAGTTSDAGLEEVSTKTENSVPAPTQEGRDGVAPVSSLVKIFGCARCKYESDKYDMVRQHLFRHLQRFMCYVCHKSYPFEYEVKKHFETHHGTQETEVVKNPNYNDEDKEELIRNIRIRIADKSSLGQLLEHQDAQSDVDADVDGGTPQRRQVARKSFGGNSTMPSMLGETTFVRPLRTIAKKSTSSKMTSAARWQLIEETLRDVAVTKVPDDSSDEEAVPSSMDRISICLLDLHAMVDLLPNVCLTEPTEETFAEHGYG